MINFKEYIKNKVINVGIDINSLEITRPPKEDMGDYALPCFTIKIEGMNNPNEKANYIKSLLAENDEIIDDINVIGPYLNFTINKELLANETIKEISELQDKYGSNNIGENKELLIEHTSINPNASPHIGRSRNSIIGNFLVELYKFEGFNVETNYFINDIGKQIAMLLIGIEDIGNIEDVTFNDMLKLYVEINERSKVEPLIEKRVFNYLNELESGNELIREKFKRITDICVKGQQDIFKKMNIKWDRFTHESDFVFGNITNDILDKLNHSGKLKEDENGRLYVDLSGYNIPTKSPVLVLTREDKTSLYPLRDIAYTIDKIKRNDENNIIVLGEDQEVYMKQIEAVLDILGYKAPKLVSYSFVLLNGDKMATREGKVVLLEEFIDKAKEKLNNEFMKRNTKLNDEDLTSLAASCIKYNMLNVNRKKVVNFNLENATDFQGNSAIYLLYNYVRINSILEKAGNFDMNIDICKFKEELEYSLINSLYDFREVVLNSFDSSESVLITNYLYGVAQKFSRYYENISILSENDEMVRTSRLALLNCTKIVLNNGLKILGIETLNKI